MSQVADKLSKVTVKKIRKEYLNLIKFHQNYESQCEVLNKLLKDKIEFDFFVMYQHSDGFVIVHQEENHNALLKNCLKIIEREGFLTFEDYRLECI